MTSIGVYREGHLHAALKELYTAPGDIVEAHVDGYLVDILRDGLIIEIQTSNFSSIHRKMRDLVRRHRVRLVHPVPAERWLVKHSTRGKIERRRSPKRGGFEQIFEELVSFPTLLAEDNFELEVVAIREEQVRRVHRQRVWRRRGWTIVERRLLEIVDRKILHGPSDLVDLLPPSLPDRFQTSHLAASLGRPRWLAQKAAYCLREAGVIAEVGRVGNSRVYARR
jgi:hypothetical protein